MSSPKYITLITGANIGIGFALAKLLIEKPHNHVLLGARTPSKGEKAVADLQALNLPGTVELLEIDVDSADSVQAAADKVAAQHGHLDNLVNNAAIAQLRDYALPTHQHLEATFRTNATGVQLVTERFVPLLRNSVQTPPRIIHVSSGAGSIERRLDKASAMYKQSAVAYRASKAALNMMGACHSVEYGEGGDEAFGAKVFLFCPGFTISNLSDFNKAEMGAKPTEEGARPMIDILEGKRDAEHGKFLHADGQYPW